MLRQTTTVAEAIRDGLRRLEGIADNPRLEARLLLAHALGATQNELIEDPKRSFNTNEYNSLLTRRINHEPIALITGSREFWSLRFQVSSATLVPRADSETVVEAAIAAFTGRKPPRSILDLGTGTGCLLLALLTEFPSAFGVGTDLGMDSAALAKTNASRLGVAERSAFVVADWTKPIGGVFDLIVSNPPYVCSGDIASLMPEVACHEPNRALNGGPDGCDAYRAIISELKTHLPPLGTAVLELGVDQAPHVVGMARNAGMDVALRHDLAGIPRAAILNQPDDG